MITLRPHQAAAADAVEQAFREGCTRPLVDACVGSGKSLIFAELARRELERGGRVIITAHTRELVEQNAKACRDLMPGVHVGINAAALGERTYRAPIISAAIQSVYKSAHSFGPVTMLGGDECHLWPHSESGMYREFARGLGQIRFVGASGTVFRLQGGSLVEGEGAPFERVVYRYSILDGIRDGYLCPAFSAPATEKIDPTKLRTSKGEFTGDSQDAQMIEAIDNHIAQMVHHGSNRRAWLCFEASVKSANAMCKRLNEWGIPSGLVLGETPAGERAQTIRAYRAGQLRCLVNVAALTTGFDVQEVDLLVMRRRTKSLGLYIQMTGRLLRTIGGNIEASIAAGKADGLVLDFAGNIDQHGPLDFIRPKETSATLVSCDECGKRNARAAAKCWACDAVMTKLCPACLENIAKHYLDCPHCAHDMRSGDTGETREHKLLDTPSGAALIASFARVADRDGNWKAILKLVRCSGREGIQGTVADYDSPYSVLYDGGTALLGDPLAKALSKNTSASIGNKTRGGRWLRLADDGSVAAVLLPNGASRTSARQILADGSEIIIPLPAANEAAA